MPPMKILAILAIFVIIILICDHYESKLPHPINFLYTCWKKFSHLLGIIMSFLILTILWIIGFGTYGIIMNIMTLRARCKPKPDSYWIDVEPSTTESLKHQF